MSAAPAPAQAPTPKPEQIAYAAAQAFAAAFVAALTAAQVSAPTPPHRQQDSDAGDEQPAFHSRSVAQATEGAFVYSL